MKYVYAHNSAISGPKLKTSTSPCLKKNHDEITSSLMLNYYSILEHGQSKTFNRGLLLNIDVVILVFEEFVVVI